MLPFSPSEKNDTTLSNNTLSNWWKCEEEVLWCCHHFCTICPWQMSSSLEECSWLWRKADYLERKGCCEHHQIFRIMYCITTCNNVELYVNMISKWLSEIYYEHFMFWWEINSRFSRHAFKNIYLKWAEKYFKISISLYLQCGVTNR